MGAGSKGGEKTGQSHGGALDRAKLCWLWDWVSEGIMEAHWLWQHKLPRFGQFEISYEFSKNILYLVEVGFFSCPSRGHPLFFTRTPE